MKRVITAAAALAVLAIAGPSSAHHSTNLSFQPGKLQNYTGEFVRFRWINPHALVEFNVVGPDGKKELWIGETHGSGVLGRAGWRPAMFKPGEKLVINANPPRNPTAKSIHVFTIKDESGKVWSVNAPRN